MMMMMNDVKLIAVKSDTSLGLNRFFFCVRNEFFTAIRFRPLLGARWFSFYTI